MQRFPTLVGLKFQQAIVEEKTREANEEVCHGRTYGAADLQHEDAEIIIVDETLGVIDTAHRPASAASRKAIEKQLAKEAEIRRVTGEKAGKRGSKKR